MMMRKTEVTKMITNVESKMMKDKVDKTLKMN